MKVDLTADEITAVRVAIRMASVVHTEMVSMSPSKDVRHMLMDAIRRLHSADGKLERSSPSTPDTSRSAPPARRS